MHVADSDEKTEFKIKQCFQAIDFTSSQLKIYDDQMTHICVSCDPIEGRV